MKDFSIHTLTPDEATVRQVQELWYASVTALKFLMNILIARQSECMVNETRGYGVPPHKSLS